MGETKNKTFSYESKIHMPDSLRKILNQKGSVIFVVDVITIRHSSDVTTMKLFTPTYNMKLSCR